MSKQAELRLYDRTEDEVLSDLRRIASWCRNDESYGIAVIASVNHLGVNITLGELDTEFAKEGFGFHKYASYITQRAILETTSYMRGLESLRGRPLTITEKAQWLENIRQNNLENDPNSFERAEGEAIEEMKRKTEESVYGKSRVQNTNFTPKKKKRK